MNLGGLLTPFRADEWVLRSPLTPAECATRLVRSAEICPGRYELILLNEVCIADQSVPGRDGAADRFHLQRTMRRGYPDARVAIVSGDQGSRIDVRAAGIGPFLPIFAAILAVLLFRAMTSEANTEEAVEQVLPMLAILALAFVVLVPDLIAVKGGYAPFLIATLAADVVEKPDHAPVVAPRAWWWRIVGW